MVTAAATSGTRFDFTIKKIQVASSQRAGVLTAWTPFVQQHSHIPETVAATSKHGCSVSDQLKYHIAWISNHACKTTCQHQHFPRRSCSGYPGLHCLHALPTCALASHPPLGWTFPPPIWPPSCTGMPYAAGAIEHDNHVSAAAGRHHADSMHVTGGGALAPPCWRL